MHSGIILIGLLALISWCIQILPVISVPITSLKDHNTLFLSHYENITFGVFGVCDTVSKTCTSPKIGYTLRPEGNYWSDRKAVSGTLESIRLPSSAAHFISKLLVVHVVGFVMTGFLVLECALILALEYLNDQGNKGKPQHRLRRLIPKGVKEAPTQPPRNPKQRNGKRRDLTIYLKVMLFLAVLSFLLNLMAFLVDILLFVPELSVLGWIQLLPISLMALIASFTCFIKRSIQSRKHLDEEFFSASSMRYRHHSNDNDDSGSDDGIYIYTNGFSGSQSEQDQQSLRYSQDMVFEMQTFDNDRERVSLST